MPGIISDREIVQMNNGKISIGDYVVFSGEVIPIVFYTNDIKSVNIILEKNGNDLPNYLNGNSPFVCKNNDKNQFNWVCNIIPDINQEYPKYRIKIKSVEPEETIAYSNYFKISISKDR